MQFRGESCAVNLADAKHEVQALRSKIAEAGYEMCNTFNMDETGLFYRMLPNKSMVERGYVHLQIQDCKL